MSYLPIASVAHAWQAAYHKALAAADKLADAAPFAAFILRALRKAAKEGSRRLDIRRTHSYCAAQP